MLRWFRDGARALRPQPKYHSKYGGLWIDREDWRQRLRRRGFSPQLSSDIEQFVADGYVIFEQAASLEAVDTFQGTYTVDHGVIVGADVFQVS